MQERKVPDWISGFLEATSNSEAPDLYREWVAVSTVASALERKVWLEWLDRPLYANMFILLIGPSGARKGTAMAPGEAMIRSLSDINLAANAGSKEALVVTIEEGKKQFTLPGGRFEEHCSVTVHNEEFTVFLGYNNVDLMQYLANWFDSPASWDYKTKHSGVAKIENLWVNILGATTPELVRTAFPREMISGGMSGRTIFVFEERKGRTVSAPFVTPALKKKRNDLVHDLEKIHILTGPAFIDEQFMIDWDTWYTNQDANPPFNDPDFDGYLSRRQVHILKLCIILAASENSRLESDKYRPLYITSKILARAVDLLERTEVKMPYTFRGMGQSNLSVVVHKAMAHIASKKTVTKGELFQMLYGDLSRPKDLDDLLDILQQSNFCRISIVGTKTTIHYNPNHGLGGTP